MKLVVDTNIVFSALLGGRTARTLARAVAGLQLHTITTLIEELRRQKRV